MLFLDTRKKGSSVGRGSRIDDRDGIVVYVSSWCRAVGGEREGPE